MKIRLLRLLLWVGIQGMWCHAVAQKKVVIMGSSTAAGYGASTYQLSWAGRLESSFNVNKMDGADTVFYNISVGGYNTYQELPASYAPPAGRPFPDPGADVTRALNYHPDIVIISLPGNDVGAGFSLTETMSNFRMMFKQHHGQWCNLLYHYQPAKKRLQCFTTDGVAEVERFRG